MKNSYIASILSIGDELLIGETINSNATFLSKMLYNLGFNFFSTLTVGDHANNINQALDYLLPYSDVIISTGGLGPTSDDITLTTFNNYFQGSLVKSKEVYKWFLEYTEANNIEVNQLNINQQLISTASKPLKNIKGTAPGLLFEKNNKSVFVLPGVPYEMSYLAEHRVKPIIKKKYNNNKSIHEYIYTKNIQESQIALKIQDIEKQIKNKPIGLAYLPESQNYVKLRFTLFDTKNKEELVSFKKVIDRTKQILSKFVISQD